jgi:adenylate cyclase
MTGKQLARDRLRRLARIKKQLQIKRTWKYRLICLAIAVFSAGATMLLGRLHFFQILHLKAQDAHFLVRGRAPAPRIVLLVIDQKSLDTIPDLMLFWHPYYAAAIRAAADSGAKVLGLDVTFAIPVTKWEPNHDQILAEAVSEAAARMPVVCGYVPSAMQKQRDWPVPVNMIAAALGLAAFTNLTVDPDDFVRRQALMEVPEPGSQEPPLRSLALRMAEKYLGTEARFERSLTLAGGIVPTVSDATILINFAGPAGTIPRVSFSDFLEAARAGRKEQLRNWVEGKAVLLGPDTATEDRHPTPFYTSFSSAGWNTAGVEIHASTLHTLLSRHFLQPAPPAARSLALVALAIATVGIIALLPPTTAALWFSVLLIGVMAGTHFLFRAGVVLSTSELLLACLLSLLAATVYRFLTAEKVGSLFRRAFSIFVSKGLALSLEDNESLALIGSRQFVTVLFSDIRGFTSFCETKDPVEIVELLNQYLAQMVSIIVSHHGNVNKFIGDGILAIFTDQDGTVQGDHVIRAVRCGLEMVCAPSCFQTGTGIHTGLAVVGIVGSPQKMEYTILGDTVNLASRLESLNKEHKTKLLMSQSTQMLLEDKIETVCLGSVAIRGQSQPMELYTAASLIVKKEAEAATTSEKPA